MFGKGGGALSTWIKEFCELVFIQTLQAFIYAIVIAFIVEILSADMAKNMTADNHNTAVGIICVIALVSIFKVEDLARKIFGFGPTKGDHGNAVKSIAKTAFAMKVGKRVLDNGAKMIGGAGAALGARGKLIKAKKNYKEDLEALDKDNRAGQKSGAALTSGGDAKANAERMAQLKKQHIEEAKKKLEMARNINDKNADGTINSKKRDQKIALMEQAQAERRAAAEAAEREKQILSGQSTSTSSGISGGAGGNIKDYNQRMRKLKNEFESKKKEIEKERKEGIKNIAKGVSESGFALIGGTAGAILGGADGNLDEAIQGGLAGMGLGDAAGESLVNVSFKTVDYASGKAKNLAGLAKEVSKKGVKQTYAEHTNKYWDKQIDDTIKKIEAQNSGSTSGRRTTTTVHTNINVSPTYTERSTNSDAADTHVEEVNINVTPQKVSSRGGSRPTTVKPARVTGPSKSASKAVENAVRNVNLKNNAVKASFDERTELK